MIVARTETEAATIVTSTALATTPAAEAITFCMAVRSVAPKLEASPDKVKLTNNVRIGSFEVVAVGDGGGARVQKIA